MKLLISEGLLEQAPLKQLVPLECEFCQKVFEKTKEEVKRARLYKRARQLVYCNAVCYGLARTEAKMVQLECSQCHKTFRRKGGDANKRFKTKTGRVFCGHECMGRYTATHKTHGSRRSKLELWIEARLKEAYPGMDIRFCEREHINAELDIYVPHLKLAFELNGIFHYEPIYGPEHLSKVQNNDNRRLQACLERGIELCIIDTSKVDRIVPKRVRWVLDIITDLINAKLNEDGRPAQAVTT